MVAIKISEGAESVVYSTNFLGFRAIMKSRIKKSYRAGEIDEFLRLRRTRDESRILALASSSGLNVPRVLLVDKYDIFMERLQGKNLHMMLTHSDKINGGLEKIMRDVGADLGALHNVNIAHGDYTPANILIDGQNHYLIDFGLSEITNSVEDKAIDLLLMKRSVSSQLFVGFLEGYKGTSKQADDITRKLGEIERRGRYQVRSLTTLKNEDGKP